MLDNFQFLVGGWELTLGSFWLKSVSPRSLILRGWVMWPQSSVSTVSELRQHFGLPDGVWHSFVDAAGDPGEDLRPLAEIPRSTFTDCVTLARHSSGRRLTVMEASQLGLLYRAAKRWAYVQGGGAAEDWVDQNPWEETTSNEVTKVSTAAAGPERKLKYGQILDQADEGEFVCHGEEMRAFWYGRYVEKMGGLPADQENPTLEQMSALSRRVKTLLLPPYTDFSVWTPFSRKVLKMAKYQTFVMQGDGSFVARTVAGPGDYQQWLASFRVMRTAFIMLDLLPLNLLLQWENHMEKLVARYGGCWHLLVEAENKARAEHLGRMHALVKLSIDQGERPPFGWKESEPWPVVWKKVLEDAEFWQEQVHVPALAWLAKGARGAQLTPMEEVAKVGLRGGLQALHGDRAQLQEGKEDAGGKVSPSKLKREAKKRKWRAEKEELANLRAQKGAKGGDAGKGGRKGSGSAEEECYAWNNGNGDCANLSPGEECLGKKKRLHRCTICKSPGHPSKDCPSKK